MQGKAVHLEKQHVERRQFHENTIMETTSRRLPTLRSKRANNSRGPLATAMVSSEPSPLPASLFYGSGLSVPRLLVAS